MLKIFDPATGNFTPLNNGTASDSVLLLNLLLQQYVTNTYLSAMTPGLVQDTIESLVIDAYNEPSLIAPTPQ